MMLCPECGWEMVRSVFLSQFLEDSKEFDVSTMENVMPRTIFRCSQCKLELVLRCMT